MPRFRVPVPTRHGTAVAGVALYGDLDRCVVSKTFEPAAAIINARILDDQIALARERMPYIRDIVEGLAKTCRIFNLSFRLGACGFSAVAVCRGPRPLVREHDAIIIVAAGNEHPEGKYPKPLALPAHPTHLLEDGLEVLRPVEALNVLTIGSITTHKEPHPGDPATRGAAGKRTSSPFTRAGALQGVVKPDLVEEGGDLAIDTKLDRWTRNAGLRIPTTGPEFATSGKLFTYSDGTSIAAPKVAHHVARLMASMPDASAGPCTARELSELPGGRSELHQGPEAAPVRVRRDRAVEVEARRDGQDAGSEVRDVDGVALESITFVLWPS